MTEQLKWATETFLGGQSTLLKSLKKKKKKKSTLDNLSAEEYVIHNTWNDAMTGKMQNLCQQENNNHTEKTIFCGNYIKIVAESKALQSIPEPFKIIQYKVVQEIGYGILN